MFNTFLPDIVQRNGNEKEVLVSAKASETTTVISHPVASHPTPNTIDTNEGVPKITNNEAANVLHERSISIPGNQDAEVQGSTCQDAPSDPERIREEEAATKAQAAFRGYLVSSKDLKTKVQAALRCYYDFFFSFFIGTR